MKAKVAETEELMASMTMSWEEKIAQSDKVLTEHKKLLGEHGASLKTDAGGLRLESKLPHLVSVPVGLDFAIRIYSLKEGMSRIGTAEADDPPQDIVLEGDGIEAEHCIIENETTLNDELGQLEEVVMLHPIGEVRLYTTIILSVQMLSAFSCVLPSSPEFLLPRTIRRNYLKSAVQSIFCSFVRLSMLTHIRWLRCRTRCIHRTVT